MNNDEYIDTIEKIKSEIRSAQYKASLENRNAETPAPNTYWDDGEYAQWY